MMSDLGSNRVPKRCLASQEASVAMPPPPKRSRLVEPLRELPDGVASAITGFFARRSPEFAAFEAKYGSRCLATYLGRVPRDLMGERARTWYDPNRYDWKYERPRRFGWKLERADFRYLPRDASLIIVRGHAYDYPQRVEPTCLDYLLLDYGHGYERKVLVSSITEVLLFVDLPDC